MLEISIDFLSKYSNQTNLYVNFRYFDIYYSNLNGLSEPEPNPQRSEPNPNQNLEILEWGCNL